MVVEKALVLICVVFLRLDFNVEASESPQGGFLEDFFQRFPYLPFAQQEGLVKTVDYLIQKRESRVPEFTTTTTTVSTTTTTVRTTKRTTLVPKSLPNVVTKDLPDKDDIWFGSTPTPLYRGYINRYH